MVHWNAVSSSGDRLLLYFMNINSTAAPKANL